MLPYTSYLEAHFKDWMPNAHPESADPDSQRGPGHSYNWKTIAQEEILTRKVMGVYFQKLLVDFIGMLSHPHSTGEEIDNMEETLWMGKETGLIE